MSLNFVTIQLSPYPATAERVGKLHDGTVVDERRYGLPSSLRDPAALKPPINHQLNIWSSTGNWEAEAQPVTDPLAVSSHRFAKTRRRSLPEKLVESRST